MLSAGFVMTDSEQKRRFSVPQLVGTFLWIAVLIVSFNLWMNPPQKPGLNEDTIQQDADGGGTVENVPTLTWPESGLAPFNLTDCYGHEVTKETMRGTPWVASFIFTQCQGPCPRVTQAVRVLYDRYRDSNLKFVSFTVDPENDTPEKLRLYAEFWKANPEKWLFLTGSRNDLYALINGSFLMAAVPAPDPKPGFQVIHTTNLCLVDSNGRVIGKYNSLDDVEMARLKSTLDELLQNTAPLN